MVIDLRVLTVQWERDALNQGVIIGFPKRKIERSKKDNLNGFCFLEKVASELSLPP